MKLTDPPATAFGGKDATGDRDAATGQFLKGYSGGSKAGRKKGARARWSEEFMADIEAAWKEQGQAVIARAMFLDPAGTLKALIGILPKHAKLEITTPVDGMTDDQLEQMLAYAEARITELQTIEGSAVDVTPRALAAPIASPTLKADQEREARMADLHAQHERFGAEGAVQQALPHPVGKPFPTPDHVVERRNRAALDDVDPASLF